MKTIPLAKANPALVLLVVSVVMALSAWGGQALEGLSVGMAIADEGPPGPPVLGVAWLVLVAEVVFLIALAWVAQRAWRHKRVAHDSEVVDVAMVGRDSIWWAAAIVVALTAILMALGVLDPVEWHNEYRDPDVLHSAPGAPWLVGLVLGGFFPLLALIGLAFEEASRHHEPQAHA